jgi:hypothetical protein
MFFKTAIVIGDVLQGLSLYKRFAGWMASVYEMSFILSICLHLLACIYNGAVWRGIIAYVSTILRMFLSVALLLFLDYSVHSVVVLLPFLLVLVLVIASFLKTFQIHSEEEVGANWGHFKDELKLRFDLCAKVANMAFAGLVGRAHGYAGVSSKKTNGRGFIAVAPEFFLFYGIVLGLLLVLLCTVPTPVDLRIRRQRVAKVYKPILSYVALSFIILASIVAVEDILQINVFFMCCFIIVVTVFYFFSRNWRNTDLPVSSPARREQDTNLSQYLLSAYFLPLFFIIMKIYSIHGASMLLLSWWFKCFLFLGLCSILNYAVHIVVFAEMPNEDSMDCWAISCTAYATYGTMVITCVCFLLVSGEIVNILSRAHE